MKKKPFTGITLNKEQTTAFNKIITMLSTERTLQPSDHSSVALLVFNLSMLNEAKRDIDVNGLMIESTTQHGTVFKQNPAAITINNCNGAIMRLYDSLLMNPKAKVSAKETAPIQSNDPLDDLLSKL